MQKKFTILILLEHEEDNIKSSQIFFYKKKENAIKRGEEHQNKKKENQYIVNFFPDSIQFEKKGWADHDQNTSDERFEPDVESFHMMFLSLTNNGRSQVGCGFFKNKTEAINRASNFIYKQSNPGPRGRLAGNSASQIFTFNFKAKLDDNLWLREERTRNDYVYMDY